VTRVQSQLVPYGLAGVAVLAAVMLRLALDNVLDDAVVGLLFAPAILIAAMLGGLTPGIIATAVCLPVVYYFVAGQPDISVGLHLTLFALVGGTIAWLGGTVQRTRSDMLADCGGPTAA
jgi:two-component system, LuxR family, sensor kinase FixL